MYDSVPVANQSTEFTYMCVDYYVKYLLLSDYTYLKHIPDYTHQVTGNVPIHRHTHIPVVSIGFLPHTTNCNHSHFSIRQERMQCN